MRDIKNKLLTIKSQDELIQYTLQLVRLKLHSQTAAIYLFSKEGKLFRVGFSGVDWDGNEIQDWFNDETHEVLSKNSEASKKVGFIGRAAKRDSNSNFGDSQFLNFFNKEELPSKTWKEYEEKLGPINCGLAIPLDGRNKTFGVLSILNKIDSKNDKPLKTQCAFSSNDFFWLSEIGFLISTAISFFRIKKQDEFENDLANLLIESSFQESERRDKIYRGVVKRLISKNTAFKACVLRLKNECDELVVQELDIDAHDDLHKKQLLKERKQEAIKIGTGLPGVVAEKLKPEYFLISEENIGRFFVNEEWVRNNQFKSFGCFPLISRDKLVGTISLYVSYEYDFHPSCLKFLNRLTTLLASFIRRVNEDEKLEQMDKKIKRIKQGLNNLDHIDASIHRAQLSASSVIEHINDVEQLLISMGMKDQMNYDEFD